MPRPLSSLRAGWLPLLWAVALGLCLNPLGAAAAALAGAAGCASAACPCEAEAGPDADEHGAEEHGADEHGADEHGTDEHGCEADTGCDDCRCGPAALLAVLPGLTVHLTWLGTTAQAQAPPADVALGVQRRMDRPPRPA